MDWCCCALDVELFVADNINKWGENNFSPNWFFKIRAKHTTNSCICTNLSRYVNACICIRIRTYFTCTHTHISNPNFFKLWIAPWILLTVFLLNPHRTSIKISKIRCNINRHSSVTRKWIRFLRVFMRPIKEEERVRELKKTNQTWYG